MMSHPPFKPLTYELQPCIMRLQRPSYRPLVTLRNLEKELSFISFFQLYG